MPQSTAWTACPLQVLAHLGPHELETPHLEPRQAGLPEAAVDALGDLVERPAADRHADQVLLGVAELLDHALARLHPASAVRTASTVIGRSKRTCSSVPPEKSMP